MAKRGKTDGDYAVGYGKPPVSSRFQKGVSGNPKGRKKGDKNLSTALVQELRQPMVVSEGGQRKKMQKGEALIKQAVNKALSGDPRALAFVFAKATEAQSEVERTGPMTLFGDAEADRATIASLMQRLSLKLEGEDGE